MSVASRKLLIKAASPPTTLPGSGVLRKRRLMSQRTLDTNENEKEDRMACQHKLNEEELLAEINRTLQIMDSYRTKIPAPPPPPNTAEELKEKEQRLLRKDKEIGELNDEISRLKEVYTRPKHLSPANLYSQQHLKIFTLAQDIEKQRKHLELHIDHHRKLKAKADNLHDSLRRILPQYFSAEIKRGLKPISYEEFRRKALIVKQERQLKEKRRSVSMRSNASSRKSSSTSIKNMISSHHTVTQNSTERNMWQMQRRKSIVNRAIAASKKKHENELKTLNDQRDFLVDQDQQLNKKIEELSHQLLNLENNLSHISFKFTFMKESMATE